jgi:subtilase family serine protease
MQLSVAVLSPKADELAMFAMEVSDPNSPLYRRFLTEEQLTALFGPSPCNYQAVIDWLSAAGIQVTMTYPDRFVIDALGTVAQIGAALHVTIGDYRRPDGTTFYGPDRDPSVTVGAAIAIEGLDNCYVPTPAVAGSSPDAGARN